MSTTVKKMSDLLSSPEAQELYKEIELTEDEIQIALLEARKNKAARQYTANYVKRIFEAPKVKEYTSEGLYELASKVFEFDETNKQIFWDLCRYFTGDPKSKLDLKKGIYLYGPIGCGKTELMKWFRHNQTNSYAIFDVREISAQYTKDGSDAIFKYKNLIESAWMPFGQSKIGVCFDDLGTEVDKKHYGNEANVMADIFLTRYRNKDLFNKTHFTTNLNANDIQERYGERVRSRMREMVNLVEFPDLAPDRRK